MSDFILEPFEPKDHYPTLVGWWEERGLPVIPLELLPMVGYFVPSTCAGFLYQTDSALALIENLISSPLSHPERRDEALDCVVQALIEHGKGLGFNVITGFTEVPKVESRATKLGFELDAKTYRLVTWRA